MRHNLVLEGEDIRLEPLDETNFAAVRDCGNDPALWEFTFQPNPFTTNASAHEFLRDTLDSPDVQAFAIIDKRTSAVAGSTRFFEIDASNHKLEIGWTFHGRRFWRTHVNTQAKLLLLRYAFEDWGAVRVQLKADSSNIRSRNAILRIGATYEGTMRNFRMRPDGELRGISMYSIIASEWPMVKERLLTFSDKTLYSLAVE